MNCTRKMEANVFGYSSETDGAWEIRADDLTNTFTQEDTFGQLHKEFKKLASHEKIAWLQTHGAVHKAKLHDEEVSLTLWLFLSIKTNRVDHRFPQ